MSDFDIRVSIVTWQLKYSIHNEEKEETQKFLPTSERYCHQLV